MMQKSEDTNKGEIVVAEEAQIYKVLEDKENQMALLDASELTGHALVYEIKKYDKKTHQYITTYEPSLPGINWLTIYMTQVLKQGLTISPNSIKFTTNKFHDPVLKIDREFVTCLVQVINEATRLETPGVAEEPMAMKVYDRDDNYQKIPDPNKKGEFLWHFEYDEFAQRKAMSKALRNAWRLQFPPEVLARLVQLAVSKGLVLRVRAEDKTQQPTKGACKCDTATKISNQKKSDGTCPVCGGVRF